MEHRFREITEEPERFFSILPADWQEGIAPHWSAYARSAKIYIIETTDDVVGGGIVFSSPAPDCQPAYLEEAQVWFENGYLYIGFFWISENHREKKMGTMWLEELFTTFPNHNFWLSIDDLKLASFYKRKGFQLIKQIEAADYPEWVMAMENKPEKAEQFMQEAVAI